MEENYSVIEWTIENFSCWDYEIHGNVISLPEIDFSTRPETRRFLKLFPRGISGVEEHLVVEIYNPWNFSGYCELSYIDSVGTLIKKESMQVKGDYSKVFVGPAYETIVSRIRENEPLHNDILFLRFRLNFRVVTFNRHARTVIDVFETSLKFNSTVFKSRKINADVWDRISIIQYPFDGNTEDFHVYAKMVSRADVNLGSQFCSQNIFVGQKTPLEELHLRLMLRSFAENEEKTLAQISLSHHCKDGILEKEVVKYVFRGSEEWIVPKSLTVKESMKNTSYILVSIRIIPGNTPKTYSNWSRYPEVSDVCPANTETVPRESSSHYPVETSKDVLAKELMHLYQDQKFSDLKIRCGEVTFAVHRGILSARSPVLNRLLSSEMKEAVSGVVDIYDLDVLTLNRFLGFLYSGTLKDLQWNSALKLYYAADKYQVPTLKKECVWVLSTEISVSNVCEILSLADRHGDDQLTSAAHGFILKNYSLVLESQEWKDFMAVDPMLLLKTLTLFGQKGFICKGSGL